MLKNKLIDVQKEELRELKSFIEGINISDNQKMTRDLILSRGLDIIGVFTLVTFNNKEYKFAVTSDNKIYLTDKSLNSDECYYIIGNFFDVINIKPKFEIIQYNNGMCCFELDTTNPSKFIKEVKIPKYLQEFMVKNNMILYSTDMAYLYGIDNKEKSIDYCDNKRAFKRIKNKSKILLKQKQGKFN